MTFNTNIWNLDFNTCDSGYQQVNHPFELFEVDFWQAVDMFKTVLSRLTTPVPKIVNFWCKIQIYIQIYPTCICVLYSRRLPCQYLLVGPGFLAASHFSFSTLFIPHFSLDPSSWNSVCLSVCPYVITSLLSTPPTGGVESSSWNSVCLSFYPSVITSIFPI